MADGGIVPHVLVAVSAIPGGMFWRNNSGALPLPNGRRIAFGLPGSADILGCSRGRAIAIECKSATGKQSRKQRDFQRAWEKAGGLYILARSVSDAIAALCWNGDGAT